VASFMPDSSVMVPALSYWHEHHERATRAINSRRGRGDAMLIAGRSLVETYSVLTRLSPGKRLSARVAQDLIEPSFIAGLRVIAMPPSGYRQLLERCAEANVIGGGAHDAEIAFCAIAANVDAFLTFNKRHFTTFVELASRVVVPEE
jgi:predicted nucleic acid-binding protein